MKEEIKGWVIINNSHPNRGNQFMVPETFKEKRKHAIEEFTRGTSHTWGFWYKKFNYRCVRATQTINT